VLRSSSVAANISGAILDPKGWYWGPSWQEPAFTSPPHWVARNDRI
jgi:hypothetical protein